MSSVRHMFAYHLVINACDLFTVEQEVEVEYSIERSSLCVLVEIWHVFGEYQAGRTGGVVLLLILHLR